MKRIKAISINEFASLAGIVVAVAGAMSVCFDYGYFNSLGLSAGTIPVTFADFSKDVFYWAPFALFSSFGGLLMSFWMSLAPDDEDFNQLRNKAEAIKQRFEEIKKTAPGDSTVQDIDVLEGEVDKFLKSRGVIHSRIKLRFTVAKLTIPLLFVILLIFIITCAGMCLIIGMKGVIFFAPFFAITFFVVVNQRALEKIISIENVGVIALAVMSFIYAIGYMSGEFSVYDGDDQRLITSEGASFNANIIRSIDKGVIYSVNQYVLFSKWEAVKSINYGRRDPLGVSFSCQEFQFFCRDRIHFWPLKGEETSMLRYSGDLK